jgi:hypothetical protein
MIYIQIPRDHNAVGFVTLAKSGPPVLCLPDDTYGVSPEHLKLLRRKRIPFKELEANTVRLSPPHDDKIRHLLAAEIQRRQRHRA